LRYLLTVGGLTQLEAAKKSASRIKLNAHKSKHFKSMDKNQIRQP